MKYVPFKVTVGIVKVVEAFPYSSVTNCFSSIFFPLTFQSEMVIFSLGNTSIFSFFMLRYANTETFRVCPGRYTLRSVKIAYSSFVLPLLPIVVLPEEPNTVQDLSVGVVI